MVLDFWSKGPRFKTTELLQGQLSLSPFHGWFHGLPWVPQSPGDLVVKVNCLEPSPQRFDPEVTKTSPYNC